ncbi:hypothetical protein FIBSPDRAFT_608168 [Athelia psychrophila]|uniref:Uncharacterized protein n=1 Tax=Athelia psychrophila TaxID=1759441 RepID=A0A166GHW2_9AGAM|nr:hypothetical protein FIBSPDRAFT_608168 [Fibularhizoctonia sp. CBS 109695]
MDGGEPVHKRDVMNIYSASSWQRATHMVSQDPKIVNDRNNSPTSDAEIVILIPSLTPTSAATSANEISTAQTASEPVLRRWSTPFLQRTMIHSPPGTSCALKAIESQSMVSTVSGTMLWSCCSHLRSRREVIGARCSTI